MKAKLQFETDKNIIISDRVSEDFQGKKLFGCDVCWTCKWFDIEYRVCRPCHHECGPDLKARDDYSRGSNCIMHPEVYRCSFWGERWWLN